MSGFNDFNGGGPPLWWRRAKQWPYAFVDVMIAAPVWFAGVLVGGSVEYVAGFLVVGLFSGVFALVQLGWEADRIVTLCTVLFVGSWILYAAGCLVRRWTRRPVDVTTLAWFTGVTSTVMAFWWVRVR